MGLDRGLNSASTNPLGIDDDDYTATTRGAQGAKGDDGASTQDYIDKYNTVVSSAAAAATSATNASGSSSTASGFATTASTQATTATTQATTATTQATTATTQASTATTKAGEASTSATASATSATASASSATAAASSASSITGAETNSANSATAASNSATAASNSATASAGSATTAAGEVTLAAAEVVLAAGQVTLATNQVSLAAGQVTLATNQVGLATTQATNSANSATAAATSLDSFQDIYLGTASTNPTTDLDGDALVAGALHFNTTAASMRVYNGSSWADAGSAVNGTSQRSVFTATAGQTTFSVIYDAGFADVYLNGFKLQASVDFTSTSGTTIVLATGATVGDIVDIVAYGAFNVANVYTQAQTDNLIRFEIDGGVSNSTYLTTQSVNGGTANG